MNAYAVIETGGKQYRVAEGDRIVVERLAGDVGDAIEFDRVLAVSNGKELSVGTPVVEGASVKAAVVEQRRGPKVVAFKQKRRKGYKRKVGHRQEQTVLKIESV